MSACIVIAVLIGIEIFHKLFTLEMVPDQRSYTWLWLCTGYAAIGYPVQLWTRENVRFSTEIAVYLGNSTVRDRLMHGCYETLIGSHRWRIDPCGFRIITLSDL